MLCSERSGSNLLRVMMDSHPQFCGPMPPHFFKIFFPLLPFYGALDRQENLESLAADVVTVLATQTGIWQFKPEPADLLSEMAETSLAGVLGKAFQGEAAANGKARLFIKDNGIIDYAFELATCYPESKFIFLVRDARDVAVSWLKSPSRSGGCKAAAGVWSAEQQKNLRVLGMLGPERVHLVHYEDLVSDAETCLRGVCSFLGETFHAGMLTFHQTGQARASARNLKDWKNLDAPLMTRNFGKYLAALSKRQIRAVETIAGRELALLGYPLEFPTAEAKNLLPKAKRGLALAHGALKLLRGGRSSKAELQKRVTRIKGLRQVEKRAKTEFKKWSRPRVFQAETSHCQPSSQD